MLWKNCGNCLVGGEGRESLNLEVFMASPAHPSERKEVNETFAIGFDFLVDSEVIVNGGGGQGV
jgi:hypothetical protein